MASVTQSVARVASGDFFLKDDRMVKFFEIRILSRILTIVVKMKIFHDRVFSVRRQKQARHKVLAELSDGAGKSKKVSKCFLQEGPAVVSCKSGF